MPRCVRNYWLDLNVDGRKSKVKTGPRSKGGGFLLNIKLRENGDISRKSVTIEGYSITDEEKLPSGKTKTKLVNRLRIIADGKCIYTIQLDRD